MEGKVLNCSCIKKAASFVMILVMLLTVFVIPIKAEDRLFRYDGYIEAGDHYTAIFVVREWDGSSFVGTDIYKAYCIDKNTFTDPMIDYHLTNLTDDNVRAIMLYSYPNVSLDALKAAAGITDPVTALEAITATQFAIWNFTNGTIPEPGTLDSVEIQIFDYLTGLSPVPPNTIEAATAGFSSIVKTIKPNGDVEIVVSYPINATSTNSDGSPIPLTLSYSIDFDVEYPGSTVVKTTDGTVNTETITIPEAGFLSDISFTAYLAGVQYIFDAYKFEKADPEAVVQPLVGFINKGFDVLASESIEVEKADGSIEISKSIQDRPEDQTSFSVTITGPDGYVNSVTVSQGSPVLIEDLEYGTYTLTETAAAGYRTVSTNPVTVTLSGEIPEGKAVFVNTLEPVIVYGAVTIIKDVTNVDDDPTEFEIKVGNYFQTLKVREGTPQTIYVPLGEYTITETAVEGYRNISITPSTFTLTSQGQTVTVVNEKEIPIPKGSITVIKEFDDDDVTDDTEFTINVTGPDGYSEVIIIAQGMPVTLDGLTLGEYTLTEESVEGYITVSEVSVSVSLEESSPDAEVVFVNEAEEIIIIDDDDIPVEEPELPQTGGIDPSAFFGLGSLIALIGIMFLAIKNIKAQITFE